jgi:hypothetical protein
MQNGNTLDYAKDYNRSLIYITSADKTPSSKSNTDFNISFFSGNTNLMKVKKFTLSSFSTNNLFNNIASYNNTLGLYYREISPPSPSVPAYVIIPSGYYNATQLAAIIQQTARANYPVLANMTCVFDTTTYKFTLTSGDANYNLIIAPVVLNGGFEPRLEGALAYIMGFSTLPSAESPSITANTLPQLNIQNIYLYSSKLSQNRNYRTNSSQGSTQTSLLLSIPLNTTSYGAGVNWLQMAGGENQRSDLYYSMDTQISQLDFSLRDQYGNILECPNNNNVNIEFIIQY